MTKAPFAIRNEDALPFWHVPLYGKRGAAIQVATYMRLFARDEKEAQEAAVRRAWYWHDDTTYTAGTPTSVDISGMPV